MEPFQIEPLTIMLSKAGISDDGEVKRKELTHFRFGELTITITDIEG